MGDPRPRTDRDDPVRNEAHGVPQRRPQGQHARAAGVVDEVEAGVYRPNVDRVFGLEDVVAGHRHRETDRATGKLVVLP
ncbi:zinc-binding dehydrogenase [Amycolatopsis sp. NPDC049253]|uniref:zinc-binding dehydrogenase n=1 Tax=Amycolatopsis sp. NPDC049253 TaxID=3155274 RepID=UPI00341DEF9E